MSAFGVFKALYREAQNLDEIANQNGIKSGVKDQIRASANAIRAEADKLDDSEPLLLESCCGCGETATVED